MMGVVKIPCRVIWVVIGKAAAAVAIIWAGGAGAAFIFIPREVYTLSSGAVIGTVVGI